MKHDTICAPGYRRIRHSLNVKPLS